MSTVLENSIPFIPYKLSLIEIHILTFHGFKLPLHGVKINKIQ